MVRRGAFTARACGGGTGMAAAPRADAALRPSPSPAGFTLIELLVVISIIAIAVGITFPYIRGMVKTSNVQMTAENVSVAVSAARAYASRNKFFLKDLDGSIPGTQSAEDLSDGYSGAAVVFTPANELRVVENVEDIFDTAGDALEVPSFGSGKPHRNGYQDIEELDYKDDEEEEE